MTTNLTLTRVHHVLVPVTDIEASVRWYETVLRASRIERFDHHDESGALFAVILQLPGGGPMLQLRLDPSMATEVAGYSPVTYGVADRTALDGWVAHLDDNRVARSPIRTARIGAAVDFASPEGLVIRLYTDPVGGIDGVSFSEGSGDR
ncbi:VOC family protein [Kribbella qitaiheensis]|uniref:VOC family protein n=1 Tax=Kribbella qitaiheensis TaxID=1544730 RepID=A0A7G6X522_9ACTN|nr:VOC family protein [Kribbella qitaiheensis]QNE21337.1 VOC family protein [Kribbella qitaiheensis]